MWVLNNFLMAAKIEKNFNQKSLMRFPQILADVRYASATIYLIGIG